ncbi:LPS export ABC transporter permease LptG [Sphingomonas sp. ID0503]|uniref:LPS export ABC transporter permease LptG n=1 Tax=Sphingomonas sp. ID0503 TaxID=3399691 RepID=UPI003AFB4058
MYMLRFFPSRTLALYMARMFLLRSFAILAALVLVLQTLDLLGESGNILAHPGNGDAALWHYVTLRLPQIVARFLPFSVLLGTLVTFVTLNQNSEVISMKAAGASAHQILAPLVVASIGIAATSFVFNERVVVRSTETLNAWQDADYGAIPPDRGIVRNVWVRDGDDLIEAQAAGGRGSGTRLRGVRIFERDGGRLVSILRADRGQPEGDAWRLSTARRFDVTTGKLSDAGSPLVAKEVKPEQFTLASVSPDEKSLGALRLAIADLSAAGRPVGALEAGWWHKIAGPLSSILMPLLGSVAAFGLARSGLLFVRAVIGMVLGFAYFVADNFALAMGNLGAYPPFLAAWAPFILFFLIGEAVLIRSEE